RLARPPPHGADRVVAVAARLAVVTHHRPFSLHLAGRLRYCAHRLLLSRPSAIMFDSYAKWLGLPVRKPESKNRSTLPLILGGSALMAVLLVGSAPGQQPRPKLPIPDAAAQTAAEQKIKATYKADYAKTKPDDMLALAAKFMVPGRENRNDAGEWFVM